MKFAPGWREDIDKVPRGGSVLLACQYAEYPLHWIRGEAVWERLTDIEGDDGKWYWASGKPVEPDFIPKAWMPLPFVMQDDN